jgi:hypothetical protein
MIRLQMACGICKRTTEAVVAGKDVSLLCLSCSENKRKEFVGEAPLALTVHWRFYEAGYERSFHGSPALYDLGDLDA